MCFCGEVVRIVGAFRVAAFVEDEVLSVLFRDQGVAAVGTVGATAVFRDVSADEHEFLLNLDTKILMRYRR